MCLGRQRRLAGGVEVVETVRLHGLDPQTYLRDVIERIAEFLPSNLKRSAP